MNGSIFFSSLLLILTLWLANCYFAHNYSGFSRLAACTSPKPREAPKSTAVSQCFRPFHMSFISRVLLILARDSPHLSLGPGIPESAAVFPPLQDHDKHSFPQDCKVAARMVLGGLHHEYRWERIAA